MGYRDPIRETAVETSRDLIEAAVVLGAHLDAADADVDDETILRALCAFMDARESYLASLVPLDRVRGDCGPPSTRGHDSVRGVVRRFGLSG